MDLVDRVQRPNGYRLLAAFEPDVEHAVAVAGFRLAHSLAWGRYLYVDDLVTLPEARGRGHARGLLRWLAAEAERECCSFVAWTVSQVGRDPVLLVTTDPSRPDDVAPIVAMFGAD